MNGTPLRFAPLLAPALLSTGCASIFLSAHDDLKVVTDPPGAVARVGEQAITTPGVVEVPRDGSPVVVEISKEGYLPAEIPLRRTRSGAIWMNAEWLALGALGTVLSSNVSLGFGGSSTTNATPILVGAALAGAGTAVDLSTNRTFCLERREVAVVLKQAVDPVAASGGGR